MSEQLEEAALEMSTFRVTGALGHLKAAVVQMHCLDLTAAAHDEDRLRAARVWLAILGAIDERRDPDFDPGDVPLRRVRRPAGPEGLEKHEAAKRANDEKAERHLLQTDLRRLDARATPAAEAFFRRHYGDPDPDRERELEALLAEAGLSPERETGLRTGGPVDSRE